MDKKFGYFYNDIVLLYNDQEALALCCWLFEEHFDAKFYSYKSLEGQAKDLNAEHPIWQQLDLLTTGKPVQQILGKAYFMDMVLAVNEHTLIPRPETEELVYMAQQLFAKQEGICVLDVGTGSGCIPVALARHYTHASVCGVDVSKEALNIAKQNAQRYQVDVDFLSLDILKETPSIPGLDLIISNPPYIVPSEAAAMHTNVLDFEPDEALFVPEEDPLLFYRRIKELAATLLKPKGYVLLEINPLYAEETAALFKEHFVVSILKDMQGKERMIKAIK